MTVDSAIRDARGVTVESMARCNLATREILSLGANNVPCAVFQWASAIHGTSWDNVELGDMQFVLGIGWPCVGLG